MGLCHLFRHLTTVPQAREVWRGELLVWTADYYRERYLGGAEMPSTWSRL